MTLPVIKIDFLSTEIIFDNNGIFTRHRILVVNIFLIILTLLVLWLFCRKYAISQTRINDLFLDCDIVYNDNNDIIEAVKDLGDMCDDSSWQFLECFFSERNASWSKLMTELESIIVHNVRINSVVRNNFINKHNIVKLTGQACSRNAEMSFLVNLSKSRFFKELLIESEKVYDDGSTTFIYRLVI